MQASDIMTTPVATVLPDATIQGIARRLLSRHISAVPVVDDKGDLVGMVSEGDLLRRSENDTERQPSWWLRVFDTGDELARDYTKSHGRHARDVMTRNIVTVDESASLAEIASILETHRIKRVPVLRDGLPVGIVSRADLIRGLATTGTGKVATPSDREAKTEIAENARSAGVNMEFVSVVVADGIASVWGMVETNPQKAALRVAAENAPGVSHVNDQVSIMSDLLRSTIHAM